MTRAEAVDGLWNQLAHAVGSRMTDSGPTALIMSGGVDSSSVAAAAVASTTGEVQVRGYSAVFPGYPHRRVDESARINALVEGLQLPSTRVRIEAGGAFALGLDFLSDWGVPATGAGYLIERPLLELAVADGARVVLDGQGGDELYALSGFLIADRVLHGRLLSSWRLTQRLPGATSRFRASCPHRCMSGSRNGDIRPGHSGSRLRGSGSSGRLLSISRGVISTTYRDGGPTRRTC
jgi:asparagine synthetase B (glutamine-hydrolysing)